ncbi:gamma-glutamylcyclotransferase, partial [Pantoea agglomerans]|nr:gamma-glutamylcyclotransferase [Pantoea agglomerans]
MNETQRRFGDHVTGAILQDAVDVEEVALLTREFLLKADCKTSFG